MKLKFFNRLYPASGYEPGEQLKLPKYNQASRYEPNNKSTVNKSIWKNPSPTQLRSSTRATTAPGHKLSNPISTIKVSGRWSKEKTKSLNVPKPQHRQPKHPIKLAAEIATAAVMEAYEAELEEWTKKAKKARKMIISTISPLVMTYVKGTKDPAEIIGRYPHKLQNWIPAKFAEFQS